MKAMDYVAAEITWRTAFRSYESRVKSGEMTVENAAKLADEATVRTQGSGARGDLSPAQMSDIGKALTLWQTFTINHINFLARDVLGIKNPEVSQLDTIKRVGRYIIGSAIISTLFEDFGGVQSPQPAPIKAIIKGLQNDDPAAKIAMSTVFEILEIIPIGNTLKFGSDPLGPAAGYINELFKLVSGNEILYQNLLEKAWAGDERSRLKLAELIGKGVGIPGTGQVVKFIRGRKRGEGIPGALIGRFTEGGTGRRTRSSRQKRRTRRSRSR